MAEWVAGSSKDLTDSGAIGDARGMRGEVLPRARRLDELELRQVERGQFGILRLLSVVNSPRSGAAHGGQES